MLDFVPRGGENFIFCQFFWKGASIMDVPQREAEKCWTRHYCRGPGENFRPSIDLDSLGVK